MTESADARLGADGAGSARARGGDSSTSLGDRAATLDIDAGETVVCTFTNTKSASLTVVKVTDPASDPQDFDFDLTGSGVPADLDLDTDAGDATLPSQESFPISRRAARRAHGDRVRGRGLDADGAGVHGRGRRFLDEPGNRAATLGYRCGRDGRLHVHEHQARVVDGREGDRSGV